jgi:hypothetical protein
MEESREIKEEGAVLKQPSAECAGLKQPKVPKASRYYYRHRDEVLARRRERLMADPEYVAKQKAREEAKKAREEAKRAREAAREEKRQKMAKLLEEAQERREGEKQRKETAEAEREAKRREMATLLGLEPPGKKINR